MLAQVVKAAARSEERRRCPKPCARVERVSDDAAQRIAASLVSGKNAAMFLGNLAQHHPQAAQLHALAQALADVTGARFGFLGEAANSVGGYIAGCVPGGAGGMNAAQMLAAAAARRTCCSASKPSSIRHDPQQAVAAMKAAELVVAMSPYQHGAVEYAHVLLPIAPFTETAGTFVNTEGAVQSFNGVVQPLGETRPAWKVLRVLGNLLGLAGLRPRQRGGRAGARRWAGRTSRRGSTTA